MDLLKGGNSPSSDTLLPVDAREKTASGTQSTPDNRQRPVSKMTYARRVIMVSLVCMLALLGAASAGAVGVPCHKGPTEHQTAAETSESSSFSAMLKSASPASLHELLHRYLPGRFRDGVFPSDHDAMEAVHREDASLATSILQLAKRDGDNSTTSSSDNPTPTETSTSTSESEPPTETTTTTSTSASPSTSSTSTSVTPSSTTSVPPPITTTSTSTSSSTPTSSPTPSSSSSLPGTSSSLSETTFSQTSSSEPGTSSSSSSQTLPSSSIPGDTTLTTSTVPPSSATTTTPPRTSKEVTQTFTSTAPDGAVATITAITYVPGDAVETPAPPGSTRVPTLQNLAANRRSDASILACAVGLAMLVLVV